MVDKSFLFFKECSKITDSYPNSIKLEKCFVKVMVLSLRASSPANVKAELLQSATRLVTAAASQSPVLHFCVILGNPFHLSDPHILHLHHEEAQPCDL